MGMSLKPCTVFTTGKESFEIADDEVEIGLGIHGEPGTHREKMLNLMFKKEIDLQF